MIAKSRILALTELASQEGLEGDMRPVLERSYTVGDLIKALQKFSPETPVEVEIPVEFTEDDEMTSEVAYVIDVFETPGETQDTDVITIRACKSDLLEAYESWEPQDDNLN